MRDQLEKQRQTFQDEISKQENDLRNAENARLNALISYLNAQAELDQTLGTTLESWDISLND